jgi:DNA (cytosine-5)-methyltransferase 1
MAKMSNIYRRPVAVDLFAGAGGFSLGIEQAGFDVLVAVENDPVHACTYSFNFPLTEVLHANASTLTGQVIKKAVTRGWTFHHPQSGWEWNGQIDLVFGGPPCQGFSLMGKRLLNDERNNLIFHFYRLVKELSPRYFIMENVPGMLVGKHQTLLQQLKTQFKAAGYITREEILNAADFGVPQKRQRLFLIGVQPDVRPADFPTPPALKRVVVRDAIADLPDLDNFPELLKTDEVLLSESQLLEMKQKTSRYAILLRSLLSEDTDNLSYPRLWNPQLLTSSLRTRHKEESIHRFQATPPNKREPTSHLQRLDLNGLCPTLRAGTGSEQGSYTSPRPIHPTLARVISVREAARLHSFPDWFRFHRTKWHGFRQVGNAVPPLLARAVGRQIVAVLSVIPFPPQDPVKLGDTQLLQFDASGAAQYWKAKQTPS